MAGYRVTKILDDKEQRFDFHEGREISGRFGEGELKAVGLWSCPHSPSNVEVKNDWSYISTPPYAFTMCNLIAARFLI